jgi:hypothetical protein
LAVGDCGIVRLASGSGINNGDVEFGNSAVGAPSASVRRVAVERLHRCEKFCELTRDDATRSGLFIIQ